MDGASASSSVVETLTPPVERSQSARKKRSLPNLLVPSRQRSTRALRSNNSPPQTAALDQSFIPGTSQSSPTTDSPPPNVPPVPIRRPSVIQSRINEARKKRDDQFKHVLDIDKITGIPSSTGASTFAEVAPRPSFSQPHRLRAQTSHERMSRPQDITTARPSFDSSSRLSPHTANFSKPNPYIFPTQGELDSFDFKLQQRPHTANLSPVQLSPKHESLPSSKQTLRPRQVSDAESSWQRSPKLSDGDWTPPWTALYAREQRGSGASGFSTGSSTLDTQRSSVFTKASVISERTEDLDDPDDYTDDILDMYYGGKEETLLHPIKETQDGPESARDKRRSMMIAQAMEASIDEAMSRQSSQQTGSSLAISESASDDTSIRLNNQREHQPPRLGIKNTTHDQYGFRKATREVTIETYDAWWAGYSNDQKHRLARWKEHMKAEGFHTVDPKCFPEPSTTMRRFVQKGIPPAWRGNAWFFYAGGHGYLDRYPGRYQDLLTQAEEGKLSTLDRDSIERDLHRTFPDNIHYKPDQEAPNTSPNPNDPFNREETRILSALRRVLSAFAIDHPKIGYCQSLNFLAGMLLLFLPEERAFWLLHIIATDILPGTHETSLEGANVDLWVLMLAIRSGLPSVWSKVGAMPSETNPAGAPEFWEPNSIRLPPISLCTTSWFMSLFIGTLPTETVLRVWDLIFYDGPKTLFRTALAIFKAGEAEIKAIQDSMEIFQVVQQLPRRMISSNDLVKSVTAKGKTYITSAWLKKQRATRRSFFAKERGVEIARKMSKAGNKDSFSSRKQSKVESTSDEFEANPALGEVPQLERVATRKASDWFVKRTQTVRKVTNPAA